MTDGVRATLEVGGRSRSRRETREAKWTINGDQLEGIEGVEGMVAPGSFESQGCEG